MNWFIFFEPVYFFKTVILIEDIKQDHYLRLRTDVTFKTLNTDFKWLAFIEGKGHCSPVLSYVFLPAYNLTLNTDFKWVAFI